jgi:hypothetical protein
MRNIVTNHNIVKPVTFKRDQTCPRNIQYTGQMETLDSTGQILSQSAPAVLYNVYQEREKS